MEEDFAIEKIINNLREKKMLKQNLNCSICGHIMKLTKILFI